MWENPHEWLMAQVHVNAHDAHANVLEATTGRTDLAQAANWIDCWLYRSHSWPGRNRYSFSRRSAWLEELIGW